MPRFNRLFPLQVFLFVADFLLLVFASTITQWLRFSDDDSPLWGGEKLPITLNYERVGIMTAMIWVLALAINGAFRFSTINGGSSWHKLVLNSSLIALSFLALLSYLTRILFSRMIFIILVPLGAVLLILWHIIFRRIMRSLRKTTNIFSRNALLIGSKKDTEKMQNLMNSSPIIGYSSAKTIILKDGIFDPTKNKNIFEALLENIDSKSIDSVFILGTMSSDANFVRQIRWTIEGRGVELVLDSNLTTIAGRRVQISALHNLPLLHVKILQGWGVKFWVKRIFDILFSSIVLLVLSPFLLLIAIIIKIDSEGPVMFLQNRVGKDGKIFQIHKFRTMFLGSDKIKNSLKETAHSKNSVLFKVEDDPRVTNFGKFLRKTSLDEFPQFLDVIFGSMSIVGPRPHLSEELNQSSDDYHRRLLVRPGITGPWQVSGRSNLTAEQGMELDLDYVENWTLSGDFLLIARTIREVISPKGAY